MKKLFLSLKKLYKDSKGFSLVELITVIAILGILGLAIGSFISYSTTGFNDSVNEIDLQYESQQTVNQVKNLVMDANRGVGMITPEDGSNPYFVAYSMGKETDESGNVIDAFEIVKIEFDSSSKQLKYGIGTYNIPAAGDFNAVLSTIDESAIATNSVLAKNVDGFNVDTSDLDSSGAIKMSVSFANKTSSYSNSSIITMRNRVLESESARVAYSNVGIVKSKYVYSVDINAANRYVGGAAAPLTIENAGSMKEATVQRPRRVGGAPKTDTYSFNAAVVAYGMSGSVKWELTDSMGGTIRTNGDGKSYADADTGEVYISSEEDKRVLYLYATSLADEDKQDVIKINVNWNATSNISFELTSTDITLDASGNSIENFKFSIPTISYTNGSDDDLPDEEKGYTVAMYSAAGDAIGTSNGFYLSENVSDISLTCNFNGIAVADRVKNFKVVVTSNCPDVDGNVYSKAFPESGYFTVANIGESGTGTCSVEWNTTPTTILRGDSVESVANAHGLTDPIYVFDTSIVTVSGNWTDAAKAAVKIDRTFNKCTITVQNAAGLNASSTYQFKIKLTVTGKMDDVDVTYTAESAVYTIGPVEFEMKQSDFPSDTNILRGKTYAAIPVTVNGIKDGKPTFSIEYVATSGGSWDNDEKGHVTIDENTGVITVDTNLNWSKSYTYKIKVTFNETTIESTKTYTIAPVVLSVTNFNGTHGVDRNGYFGWGFLGVTYYSNNSWNLSVSGGIDTASVSGITLAYTVTYNGSTNKTFNLPLQLGNNSHRDDDISVNPSSAKMKITVNQLTTQNFSITY